MEVKANTTKLFIDNLAPAVIADAYRDGTAVTQGPIEFSVEQNFFYNTAFCLIGGRKSLRELADKSPDNKPLIQFTALGQSCPFSIKVCVVRDKVTALKMFSRTLAVAPISFGVGGAYRAVQKTILNPISEVKFRYKHRGLTNEQKQGVRYTVEREHLNVSQNTSVLDILAERFKKRTSTATGLLKKYTVIQFYHESFVKGHAAYARGSASASDYPDSLYLDHRWQGQFSNDNPFTPETLRSIIKGLFAENAE